MRYFIHQTFDPILFGGRNMARLLLAFLLWLLLAVSVSFSQAASLYPVGTPIEGREYYNMYKRWYEREFSIWMGVTNNKKVLLVFKGETGVGMATVVERDAMRSSNKLLNAVSKAIEWAEIARDNYADTSRGLGCFGADPVGTCERSSKATEAGQMSLRFFAANEGRQTDLIIHIIDRQGAIKEAKIYIDYEGMKKLRDVIFQIRDVYKKAKENAEKQDLFD